MKRIVFIIPLIIALSLAAGCAKSTDSPPPEASASRPAPSAAPSVTARPGTSKSYYTVEKNGRRGVVNELGQIVLPFEYAEINMLYYKGAPVAIFAIPAAVKTAGQASPHNIGFFHEGLLYGTSGSLIYQGQCRFANPIGDGLIELYGDEKCGVISYDGKEVIPFQYNSISLCGDYIVAASGDFYSILNKTSDVAVYDKGGKLQNSGKLSFVGAGNNLIMVSGETGAKGLVDLKFKEVVPAVWDELNFMDNGLIIARRGEKYGVIDSSGKEIIPVKFGYPSYYYDQNDPDSVYFYLSAEDGAYIYDGSGKKLFYSDKFASAAIAYGAIIAQDWNGVYHYIDSKGKDIIPPAQSMFADPSGFIVCYDSEKCTCYTKEGGMLPLPEASSISVISPQRFIFTTKDNWLYGVCDAGGNIIVPAKYTYVFPCYDKNDLAVFTETEKSGKARYGVIDSNDGSILQGGFDMLSYADSGLFHAQKGTVHGLIDINGTWIWQASDYQTLMD